MSIDEIDIIIDDDSEDKNKNSEIEIDIEFDEEKKAEDKINFDRNVIEPKPPVIQDEKPKDEEPVERWSPDDEDNSDIQVVDDESEWDPTHRQHRRRIRRIVKKKIT